MPENIDVIDKFLSEGVFPKCRNEYLQCERENSRFRNNFSLFCRNVTNMNNHLCEYSCPHKDFIEYCQKLGVYLDHVVKLKKLEEDRKRSCLYFFYKLKDMVKKYNGICKTTNECYEEIRKERINWGIIMYEAKISDICKNWAESNDINDDIFKKLQYLEELYIFHEKFNENNNDCPVDDSIINEYQRILEKCKDAYENITFQKELGQFQEKYNEYVKKNEECRGSSNSVNELSVQGTVTTMDTVEEATPVADAVKNGWRNIGTGVGVFTVVLLINMFILYKVKNKFNLLSD